MKARIVRIATLAAALVAAFVGVSAPANAQAITVSFVDGDARQLAGSTWKALAEGDAVDGAGQVELGANSYLELKASGATLCLSQAGTYAVRELLAAGRSSKAGAAQAALSKYMSALSAKGVVNASTVAGVRGAEQGKDEGADWVTNDTDVYLSAAKDYIASGNYAAAEEQLAKARDCASDARAEIDFYMAEAETLSGNSGRAFRLLSSIKLTGSEPWAPDYALLKARLLVDSRASKAAVELLAGWPGIAGDSGRAPLYYFILALAYKDSGDAERSRAAVERLMNLAPDGELARAAASLEMN
jgi:tetratricopeptide (TPR) repeat protein